MATGLGEGRNSMYSAVVYHPMRDIRRPGRIELCNANGLFKVPDGGEWPSSMLKPLSIEAIATNFL